MSGRSFTHLHTHTEFSMLDGAARVGDLVTAAVADGQPALGITDHGNMYGVLDFYKACRAQGITPIIGTEAYMAGESRHERPVRRGKVDDTGGDVEGGQKLYYHLTLLSETVEGYRNLLKLSSAAYLEGYYYKPRLDWELLERHPRRPDRHHRLPGRGGAPGPAGRRRGRGRAPGGPPPGHLRPRQPLRRDPGPRPGRAAPDQPAADRDRPPHQRAAAGHQRQPLHPPRGRGGPRRPALRPDRGAAVRHQPVQVRRHRALPQVGRRDAPPLLRGARGLRQHAAHRRAGRRPDRAGQAEPARVPGPGPLQGRRRTRIGPWPTCGTSPSRGPGSATAPRCRTRSSSGWTTSSASSATWGSPPTSWWCGT